MMGVAFSFKIFLWAESKNASRNSYPDIYWSSSISWTQVLCVEVSWLSIVSADHFHHGTIISKFDTYIVLCTKIQTQQTSRESKVLVKLVLESIARIMVFQCFQILKTIRTKYMKVQLTFQCQTWYYFIYYYFFFNRRGSSPEVISILLPTVAFIILGKR